MNEGTETEGVPHFEEADAGKGQRKAGVRKPGVLSGKTRITAIAAACVVAVMAIGFSLWHTQPSFCNAVCHNPMDTYVKGYSSSNNDLLIATHKKANLKCLDCHEPTLSEQVAEAGKWITADFETPLHSSVGTREFCLNCHGDDWDETVATTAEWPGTKTVYNKTGSYNPHDNHRGDEECTSCHSMHGTSTLYCVSCHNLKVPAGWNGFE